MFHEPLNFRYMHILPLLKLQIDANLIRPALPSICPLSAHIHSWFFFLYFHKHIARVPPVFWRHNLTLWFKLVLHPLPFWEVFRLFPSWYRIEDLSITQSIFTDITPVYQTVQSNQRLNFVFERIFNMLLNSITIFPLQKYCSLLKEAFEKLDFENFSIYLRTFLSNRIAPLNALQATRLEANHIELMNVIPKFPQQVGWVSGLPFIEFTECKGLFEHFVTICSSEETPSEQDTKAEKKIDLSVYFGSVVGPYLSHPDTAYVPFVPPNSVIPIPVVMQSTENSSHNYPIHPYPWLSTMLCIHLWLSLLFCTIKHLWFN